MFRREMQVNFKNFLIWLFVLMGIFLIVFLIYPSILSGNQVKQLDELMKIFPQEVLVAFNMDLSSISSTYGWLKSEGFVFILLIIGAYAGMLGSNILLKEENDKTIEYLNSLPVSRRKIVMSKVAAGLIYIFLMVLGIGLFNYVGLVLSGSFDEKQYLFLCITPLFPAIVIYFLSLLLAVFIHKTKKMIGISLGLVFVSYVVQILSNLSKNTEFLKYFSVFTLADIREVITTKTIDPIFILITLGLSLSFLLLTIICYQRKDLV